MDDRYHKADDIAPDDVADDRRVLRWGDFVARPESAPRLYAPTAATASERHEMREWMRSKYGV